MADGSIFEGQWKAGVAHGYGVLLKSDLGRVEGQFVEGMLHGHCCEYFPDESYFYGNYERGLKQGFGEYDSGHSGLKYRGQFLRGKADGAGVLTYPSGERFQGQFKDNKREGFGILTKPDGILVKGCWVNDLLHGQVTIDQEGKRYSSITSFEKTFKHGKEVGH